MAKRLSTPITDTVRTAQQISKGYFGDRISGKSDTKEIMQLTGAINNLAETLEKQELLRKRMASDVAHELRTPLATLQSHLEAMIDGVWEPDVERLASCHEEIIRINRMVGDMEKLSRLESETVVIDKTLFDVSGTITRIIRNFETEFAGRGIGISFSGQREIIFADRDKISQVVVNLLSNALKYTREGGNVEVGVIGRADGTDIFVRDDGAGISKDDLPFIFERFYRADKSRNRLTGGSGIGLTISKAIIEAHKGTISVSSEPGKGSEFIITLPKQEK